MPKLTLNGSGKGVNMSKKRKTKATTGTRLVKVCERLIVAIVINFFKDYWFH